MRVTHTNLKTYVVSPKSPEYPFSLEGLVAPMADGRLAATWTTGGTAEPLNENITRMAFSGDGGKSWTKAVDLFSHPYLGLFTTVLDSHAGKLSAYFATYSAETNFAMNMQSYISESADCGVSFSTPKSLPGALCAVHPKQALRIGGKLMLPCSWREIDGVSWTFPNTGTPPRAARVAGRETPHMAIDPASDGETRIGECYNWINQNTREYAGLMIYDESAGAYRIYGRIGGNDEHGRPLNLCEPTMTPLADGTLLMYIRANHPARKLYESRSRDGGRSWSAPKALDIPTPVTKVRLYRDAEGAIYLLHNPSAEARNPLSLWISRDDAATWREKYDLIWDDERPVAYPDGYIDEATGDLCFVWDDREAIYFSRWQKPRS